MAQGDGGFMALPTFGVIPALNVIMDPQAKKGAKAPGLNYGFDRMLAWRAIHRAQATAAAQGQADSSRIKIKDIFDKGKHAFIVTEIKTYDENGDELIINELTSLVRGAGGWGGDRGPSAEVQLPDRAADQTTEETIPVDQALLYRLSGDWNPLHVDPNMAKAFGFDKPILHGLCTFGYATRHVINAFSPMATRDYFKSIKVRFADSVFPARP